MKHTRIMLTFWGIALVLTGTAFAQGMIGAEPDPRLFGAPTYPGAVFIRTITGLDPYHATAVYVTSDDVGKTFAFFKRKLPGKRWSGYEEGDIHVTVILMNAWSKIPESLTRDDIELLDMEPNVQINSFDPSRYETLIGYLRGKPGNAKKINALHRGKSMVRYTYRLSDESTSMGKAAGVWRATDRDLKAYYGSTLKLQANGRYTFTFPDRKSETGTYMLKENIISFETAKPARGLARKDGDAIVGRASLTLQLTGLPRLTFIRVSSGRQSR